MAHTRVRSVYSGIGDDSDDKMTKILPENEEKISRRIAMSKDSGKFVAVGGDKNATVFDVDTMMVTNTLYVQCHHRHHI